jgi:hypothetical protein
MDDGDIAARRMWRQHLWTPEPRTPTEVVSSLGAMQAQELAVARWSIGQRTAGAGAGAADVDRALAAGEILRTHILRPTWHFVAGADLRWLRALSAPRVHALNAYYYRQLGLDDRRLAARAGGLIARALEGGRHLTRDELGAVLARARIAASGPRLAYILMRAELDGVVASGAARGKRQTYAAFDERVPAAADTEGPDREQALAELVRRYFTTRGPATLKDFLRWSSLTAAEGKRGLEMVGAALESVAAADGRAYLQAAGARATPREKRSPRSPRIDLVQGFDEYVMSYSESKDVLFAPPAARPSASAARPPFLHAVLLDGRLIGHWRHALKTRNVLESRLFRALTRPETAALAAAVARYARFLGTPLELAA